MDPHALRVEVLQYDSAVVRWDVPVGVDFSRLEYGPTGFVPGTGTVVDSIVGGEWRIGGLEELSTYDVYVTGWCRYQECFSGTVDTSFIGRLKDSLLAMIDYSQEESEYWHSIPTRLYAGVSASLGQFLRVGYLLQGQFYNGIFNSHHSEKSHHAFNNTLSAHINLFNWLELSVANSFSSDGRGIKYIEWFNPGIALTFSPGRRMQFFAALEYLSSTHLRELKSAHFMFGINVVGLRN
jgi:hypothetical protein